MCTTGKEMNEQERKRKKTLKSASKRVALGIVHGRNKDDQLKWEDGMRWHRTAGECVIANTMKKFQILAIIFLLNII